MYQQPHNPESQLFDRFGDTITGGGWSLMKWIFVVFVKVNAMLLMVFLRKNMGGKMMNFSVYFFGIFWFFITFLIATESWHYLTTHNAAQGHRFSGGLLWSHAQAFYFLLIYRGICAWINLRHSGQKGVTTRHSYSIGDSVIYPVLRWLLRPLGLIDDGARPTRFWKITEDRWMQLWEPLMIVVIGYWLGTQGYGAYGNFLICAGLCLGLFTFQAYNNSARIRQAQGEASVIHNMLPGGKNDDDTPKHIIGK